MAARVIKSIPKTGTVSRRKVRAAVRVVRKAYDGKVKGKGVFTKGQTASGSKKIAFRTVSAKSMTW